MTFAGGKGGDVCIDHLDGLSADGSRAVAQASITIVAHGPQAAVHLGEIAGINSASDVCDAGINHLEGRAANNIGSVAQLAVVVVSHGPKAAVLLDE